MKYTLDRIEEDVAVIEADDCGEITTLKVPLKYVGVDVKEGAILKFEDNMYVPDVKATDRVRAELLKKLNKLR